MQDHDETHLKCSRSAARASREKCSRNLGPVTGAAVCLGDPVTNTWPPAVLRDDRAKCGRSGRFLGASGGIRCRRILCGKRGRTRGMACRLCESNILYRTLRAGSGLSTVILPIGRDRAFEDTRCLDPSTTRTW